MLGVAGGASLIESLNWGLYLVTASYVALLAVVAMNAWSIMLGIGQDEKQAKEKPKKASALAISKGV